MMAPKTQHGHCLAGVVSHEYGCWANMKQRCMNANATFYKRYGGAGVIVCERWLRFDGFLADMGPAPSANHSLDRWPNKAGDYTPGNVRWATRMEQAHNKRPYVGNKLRIETVRAIRSAVNNKGETRRSVAKRFGVTYATITDIVLARTWKGRF